MFEDRPKALYALALANTDERFGYYTMMAVFSLFLRANFGLSGNTAGVVYGVFLALVYFLPLIGSIMADKFGYGEVVTISIIVTFADYLFLSIPLGGGVMGYTTISGALLFVSLGTSLFKDNLQVMVSNLYDAPELSAEHDSGFSIFYMAISIGALFAPTTAVRIKKWAGHSLGYSGNGAYHFSFAVAHVSLIVSVMIYYAFRSALRHVEVDAGKSRKIDTAGIEGELTPQQTKEHIVTLCLVSAAVIFFWISFHQNGLIPTFFADEFVSPKSGGVQTMAFDVANLVMIIFMIYNPISFFQGKTSKAKLISTAVFLAAIGVLVYKYHNIGDPVDASTPVFQQFNPLYAVTLTPVSMAISGALAAKGREPTAPRRVAYGMIIAGSAYLPMVLTSCGLFTPNGQTAAKTAGETVPFASGNWLIGTYLILIFGELLLSPISVSFVSKVAPPKYKGTMVDGWLVAAAIGNLLVSVGGFSWNDIPLTIVQSVFIALCLLSAGFTFLMTKCSEKVVQK